ncbi:MAG: PEP-CTERM sorting domain-containing protein, partial [Gloeobacteraceae cyanobacterium ES-bin-144]|nr:PEP-CTERM sorting domain-containing protein [Verrucomicrobiales bacterium]
ANVPGTTPWGGNTFTSSIDSAARWVWHSSNGDLDPTKPGFNHDEWLVFRIQVGAVPEPSSLGLLGGAACLLALRRRRV